MGVTSLARFRSLCFNTIFRVIVTICLLQHFIGYSSWACSLAALPLFLSTTHGAVESKLASLPKKSFSPFQVLMISMVVIVYHACAPKHYL